MRDLIKHILFMVQLSLISVSVSATEMTREQVLTELDKLQSSAESKQNAINLGRQRALLCSQCHGEDGNSTKPDVPNLAGQNTLYVLDQIEKFADGRRKNYVMNALAKNFSFQDKLNLAIFYATMPVKQQATDANMAAIGRPIYASKCSACHGVKGIGQANYARLAGQRMEYVESTLYKFRDNNQRISDNSTTRTSAVMEAVSKNLSDSEIRALATYIAQLQ